MAKSRVQYMSARQFVVYKHTSCLPAVGIMVKECFREALKGQSHSFERCTGSCHQHQIAGGKA